MADIRPDSGRNSIMKMLLSSGPVVPTTSTVGSGLPSPTSDTFDDNPNRLTTYLHQLAGSYEVEVDVIVKDHSYARPWNWKPENVYVKPTKKLFFSKTKNTLSGDKQRQDEDTDIEEGITEPFVPPYDLTRARHLMDEFQRLANFARPDENDDWEEKIEKTAWSPVQNRIFTKVVRILTSERLARLTKENSLIEPVFRRTSVDTAARRFRETLASAGWDWRIAQWLHNLLFDQLPQEYLAIYLDILQTLRLKIPQLIDKMIAAQPNINAKGGPITWETLGSLLKRSWDPVASSLNASRPKKLPGNPILIIAPSGVGTSISSRQHKWISQLGTLGMVVSVHTHLGLATSRMAMIAYIDQLVQATRTKIQDVRGDCPGRPIVLVGFNTGAALACQVAQMEHVTAVICLGFPFVTAEGKRGTPDDTLMDIRCPVMFVIGQNATLVKPDDLEDLREKMLVETSLVVVGTADDHLRISIAKKISEGITQSMVDRCILDEIGDFVGSILLQPHPLPLRSTSLTNFNNKNNKKESLKRKNSTSSSVESEPNSPSVKKSRPGTPISSTASTGTTIPRSGTLATQQTLVTISGSNINHMPTSKRKPRATGSQKTNLVEHIMSPRVSGQQNINTGNGGITLNIGSLASLAPIGPIRLAPSSISQTMTTTPKGSSTLKSPTSFSKMPKIISTNINLQSAPKMKTVMSASKGFSKVTSSNYKHINITDKGGEAKLVNVLTTTGNQVRVSASTAAAIQNKSAGSTGGALTTLLQNGKNSIGLVSGLSTGKASSASSILLTPSSSAANTIASTASITAAKVMDNVGASSSAGRMMPASKRTSDTSKISLLPSQATVSCSKNYPLGTSCGNVVMLTENSRNSWTSSSMIVPMTGQSPITILPLSNKVKTPQKTAKAVPKITVNSYNLQRAQRAKSPSPMAKNFTNDLDDDLGNILDIPIIFAKDGENLSSIEKVPSQIPVTMDSYDKNIPKVGTGTKVVLISNKHEKLQQSIGKIVNPTAQTIVRPNVSAQNVNHAVLQARSQNPSISAINRTGIQVQNLSRPNQPTIKYTKIILAKRNSVSCANQGDRSEQVILTKNIQKLPTTKIVSYEKNEHRYAQMLPRIQTKFQESLADDTIEIEDAIKTNIIERKMIAIPEIDLTSPKKNESANESLKAASSNVDFDKKDIGDSDATKECDVTQE